MLLFCCTVSCEFHIMEITQNLSSRPFICFEYKNNDDLFISKLTETAKSNDITIYTVNRDYKDYNSLGETIYCMPEDEDIIKNELNLSKYNFKSLLYLNGINIEFKPLSQNNMIGNNTLFHLIGNSDQIRSFCKDIRNVLPVSRSKLDIKEEKAFTFVSMIPWLLSFLLILIITNYDVNCNKKEAYIRIAFGEKTSKILASHICPDIIVYFAEIIVIRIVTNKFTSWYPELYAIAALLFITCIIPYLKLSAFDVDLLRKDKFSQNTLRHNNTFAFVTACFSIAAIMGTLSITGVYGDYMRIDDFVRSFEGYSLCDFQYLKKDVIKDVYQVKKRDEKLNELIYRNYADRLKPVIFCDYAYDNTIYANLNSYDYLSKNIKEIKTCDKESDILIFVPAFEDENYQNELVEKSLEIVHITEGESFEFTYQVIKYHDKVNLITVSNIDSMGEGSFRTAKNPTVIYNSLIPQSLPDITLDETSRAGYMDDIMYNINPEILAEIKSDLSIENEICSVTNLKEYYDHSFKSVKRITFVMYCMMILILFFEILINIIIVTLNYRINSMELALKKVFGYSLLEKNRKIFASSILSVSLAAVVNLAVFKSNKPLIIGAIVCIFVIVFLLVQIKRTERENTSIIIKRK